MTIWDCRTHVRMKSMTSSVEWTDLDFKISVALLQTICRCVFYVGYSSNCDNCIVKFTQDRYSIVQRKKLIMFSLTIK